MNDSGPNEFFWKIIGFLGSITAGILALMKIQSNRGASDERNIQKFEAVDKKFQEVDKHIEFGDVQREEILGTLRGMSLQINQFGIFDVRLKQLENENLERKEENKQIMSQLRGIYNKMNQIEVSISNKQNRL